MSLLSPRTSPRARRFSVGEARNVVAPVAAALLLAACVRSSSVGPARPAGPPGPAGAAAPGAVLTTVGEMQRLYRGMGLIAGAGSIPFVASVSFLTAPASDTTLVLLALSLPSRSLSFTREGDRYAAEYSVRLEARRGTSIAAQLEAKETVRVPTFRETTRTDESVIWQQYLRLAPGRYALAIAIKDESGLRNASEEVTLDVPQLAAGAISSPVAVYEVIPRTSVDSIPRLLARPRSTVTFGVDSIYPLYVEASGPTAPSSVDVRVMGEGDIELWKNTVDLPVRGALHSATVAIPVSRLGVGVSNITVTAPGRADTSRARVLVSLGDDLPIATFDEMLGYLRYFVASDKLKTLRTATPAQRADAWAQFLKDTDPVPGTAENEALRDYFGRIRTANTRYREDGPIGWQTDRGTAFVALGDPDNIFDSGLQDPSARVRQQVWEYRALRLQLVFLDQSGFGRWRLGASARAELENAIRRKLSTQP
jgi:GWxTD domain-containing protein